MRRKIKGKIYRWFKREEVRKVNNNGKFGKSIEFIGKVKEWI